MTIDDLDPNERTKCEIWTRCMGYYRPISYFNAGKQQEHADRVYFKVPFTGAESGVASLPRASS